MYSVEFIFLYYFYFVYALRGHLSQIIAFKLMEKLISILKGSLTLNIHSHF
jgi:hypothetical protein